MEMFTKVLLMVVWHVPFISSVRINVLTCGIDRESEVEEGKVQLEKYPWYGVLYYMYAGDMGESRATTAVVLIQEEFCLAAAADVSPMPKHNFRENSRVMLGHGWEMEGRRVRNYYIHPESEVSPNTLALVQLSQPVRDTRIKPICPPPERLRNPEFYILKMGEDMEKLEKHVLPATHVPAFLCKEFYVETKLYAQSMRPTYVTCAVSDTHQLPCVWNAAAVLVTRDVWGRWQLLGLGVRGPGCGAPSRYLDVMSYQPWIDDSLHKFQRITISKINKQKYVLRQASTSYQRFGNCDPEEKINLIYRETIVLRTNNNQYQFMTYNMTIKQEMQFSCLTLELINASAVSEMRVKHFCVRKNRGPACYAYRGSLFYISVFMMFSDKCLFEMHAWGYYRNMSLIDKQEWKWEEGTYYADFDLSRVEYRGPTDQTLFGFEPVDEKMWVPAYDVWTTTEFDNSSLSSTTPLPTRVESKANVLEGPTSFSYTGSTMAPEGEDYLSEY